MERDRPLGHSLVSRASSFLGLDPSRRVFKASAPEALTSLERTVLDFLQHPVFSKKPLGIQFTCTVCRSLFTYMKPPASV